MSALALAVRLVTAFHAKFGEYPPDFDASTYGPSTHREVYGRWATWYLHSPKLVGSCESIEFIDRTAVTA